MAWFGLISKRDLDATERRILEAIKELGVDVKDLTKIAKLTGQMKTSGEALQKAIDTQKETK